ncbi:MAG TPA: hypothetical protein PKZ99_05680 [Azospirillaceae bacterium]|nr:hypothetical protein [Azospirillaceae bacterium]
MVRLAERLLAADEQNEASYRAAAHLCYYAVYHLVARYFGLDPSDYAAARHEIIRDVLKKTLPGPGVPQYVILARRSLPTLWRLRVLADYHLNKDFSADDADQSLADAQRIFAAA